MIEFAPETRNTMIDKLSAIMPAVKFERPAKRTEDRMRKAEALGRQADKLAAEHRKMPPRTLGPRGYRGAALRPARDDYFTSSGFSSSRSIKRSSLAVGSGTGRVPSRIVLRGAQRKAQPSRAAAWDSPSLSIAA
jgi:hypothetical protein